MRQRLFVDALAQSCKQVDVLYLAHHDPAYVPNERTVTDMQAIIHATWGPTFTLHVCRREQPLKMKSPLAFVRAAASIFLQRGYASVAGDRQRDALLALLRTEPDLVFVHRLASMPPLLRLRQHLPPVFFDLDDVEHIALWRNAVARPFHLPSLATVMHVPALMAAERAAIRLASMTFLCSELDVAKLSRKFHTNNLQAVPNSTRIPGKTTRSSAPRLLMLGNYGYLPNRQGVEFFVEHIFPMVRKALPGAELLIAGANQGALSFTTHPPSGVHVLGFVDRLDDLYQQAFAVVCPIYSGAGTRVKVIEAAAYGMPIIATRIGAEGIPLQDGVEILLADSPEDFAQACVRVLSDQSLASRLGAAARTAAVARFDRTVIVEKLAAQFLKAVSEAPSA